MDKNTAKKLLVRLIDDLDNENYSYSSSTVYGTLLARYRDIMIAVSPVLPEHKTFISQVMNFNEYEPISSALKEIVALLDISEQAIQNIDEGKIFASVEDKIKQAGISFKNQDYPGVFNNLNTALELMLKEKLQIPTTITDINTTNIIEILISEKLGPTKHLEEVKKRLLFDAHTKHRGYIPQPNECVHALKAMEDLKKVLEPMTMVLSEGVQEKIYSFVQSQKT